MTRSRTLALLVGAVLLGAALVFGLGGHPLLDPDEGRNAEVAREMAASGNYFVPQFDGLPYPDKPALHFVAVALSIKALGATAFAARLPSLLATCLTLALVAWHARRRYGDAGAWTAVLVTATTPLTIAFARTVIFDATLTLFVTTAVIFLVTGADADRRAWVWVAAGWGAVGLGILTKGPIALALPLMVVLPWAIWRRRWRTVLDPVGILFCIALVTPWVLVMSQTVPGFVRYALFTETLERLTTTGLGRRGPIWYFIPIVIAGALPWSLLLGAAAGRIRAEIRSRNADAVLLVSWILIPLIFFSLSQSKRPQYLVPLMPAVGLLVAHVWRTEVDRRSARIAGLGLAAVGAVMGLVAGALARAFGASLAVQSAVPLAGWLLGTGCVLGGAIAFTRARHRVAVVAGLALPAALIPIAGRGILDAVGRERSSEELARAIRPALQGVTRVVAAGTFPLSLPYYIEARVLLASADGAELTSNYLVRNPAARNMARTPLRPAEWWRDAIVSCERPVIVVVRQDDRARRAVLAARVSLLIETPRYAAYGPCGKSNLASVF